jgi:signal transduction histidine kinase
MDPDKALYYANVGLKLVQRMNWDKGLSVYNNDIGNIYLNQSKHKEAIQYFLKSLDYTSKYPIVRAMTLHNVSVIYLKEDNIQMALQYNLQAFELAYEENLTTTIGSCYTTFGDLYLYKKDKEKAKEYYLKANEIWEQEDNIKEQATVLMHLGEISDTLSTRINYYLDSKLLWDSIDPAYFVAISNSLGLAEEYINLAKSDSLRNVSRISMSKAQLIVETEIILKDAIKMSLQSNTQQNLMFAYGKLAELEQHRGNYKKALEYINLNYELYISIFSQENKNKIAAIETQKAIDIKNKEIEVNRKEKLLQRTVFIIGLFLLGMIAFLFYYQSRNRKIVNQQLLHLNLELDRANNAKIQFFSILNHDLRRPVSNLIDFLHIQKSAPELLDDATRHQIENSTLSAVENLLSSMEDILLWSKSHMQYFKPQPKNALVRHLFEYLNNHFVSEKNVTFEFEAPLDMSIYTDENYLKTILRNLIGNAVKALNSRLDPIVKCKAWKENQNIIISISDNGSGASLDNFKILFSEHEMTNIDGGFGLHLIRDLAKAIHCKIRVESIIDEGTTIYLEFNNRNNV